MAVGEQQNALCELRFDPGPAPCVAVANLKSLQLGVQVVELQGAGAAIVAAQSAAAALECYGLQRDFSPPLLDALLREGALRRALARPLEGGLIFGLAVAVGAEQAALFELGLKRLPFITVP